MFFFFVLYVAYKIIKNISNSDMNYKSFKVVIK